jgi:hypothetical protein
MIDIKKSGKQVLAAAAILTTAGLGAGLTSAAAQAATIRPTSHPATEPGSYTSGASVYSDQWEHGYRGWVKGTVFMLCWADGAWAHGTNRWFAIWAGGISGFVNADLVSHQIRVPKCG